jgi:hypothetical protein
MCTAAIRLLKNAIFNTENVVEATVKTAYIIIIIINVFMKVRRFPVP